MSSPKLNFATPSILMKVGLWLLICRHVLSGVLTLLLIFPGASRTKRNCHIQKWSIQLLNIFGVDLKICGENLLPSTPFLLASNHISWMDIHAINAFRPIRFVAKSEVEGWPIFGWMAKQLGTVFINRENSRHAKQVVSNMTLVLRDDSICIFPEGTSTVGNSVRPFKANLFESAVLSGVPVYSLAIQYLDNRTGLHTDVPAFIDDMGLIESMANILKHRNICVLLTFFPPLKESPSFLNDRKWLALHCQANIAGILAK